MSENWLDKSLAQTPLVVIDLETTGLEPVMGHRVVEIGAARYENWTVQAELSVLIQPGRAMDPGASRVNKIYDADLAEAPPFAEVLPGLLALTRDAILVAHNAPFDAGFLSLELGLAGQPRAIPNAWLDTLGLARRNFYFGRNNLGHVARQLGVRVGRAHRALSDVYTTAAILKRMAHDLTKRRLESVGDLLLAQGGPVLTPPSPVVALPAGYRAGQPVSIRYRSSAGSSDRTIIPRYATTDDQHIYIIAYCQLRREQRTFRHDRIRLLA